MRNIEEEIWEQKAEEEEMLHSHPAGAENGSGTVSEETEKEKRIRETGQVALKEGGEGNHIQLISIIGEIEGHENLSGTTKTTKYEHILPKLAQIEEDKKVDGLLLLLNTMGGDVESGLAIA